jgi:TatD DNase family protein
MLVDSHCHLDFPDFDSERDAVVERARANGVGHMVSICTRIRRFEAVRALAAQYEHVWCTVGTHPHSAAEEPDITTDDIVALTTDPKVVGIGESGLDYHYNKSPHDVQQAGFRRHLQACMQTGLPIIVHTREADDDMLRILREEGMGQGLTGVLHCFSSGRALAEAAVADGFFVSFSGILTFRASQEVRDIARDLPLDRLLVETDSPYLAPMPMRGKRNEPAFVRHTARVLAECKGVSEDAIAAATTDNFFRLFTRAAPAGSGA